jgi:nitrogen fixation NifU-like protein
MYSSQVQRLLHNLPNRGSCQGCTNKGRAENPICGDVIELQLQIVGGQVLDCTFRAYGCPGALAAAAGLTEIIKGQTVDSCRTVDETSLLRFLGGLPKHKEHGVALALAALSEALN